MLDALIDFHTGCFDDLAPARDFVAHFFAECFGRRQRGFHTKNKWLRRNDRAVERSARAEFGADAGEQPGVYSWRPVCQYRAWLQYRNRHQGGTGS